MYVLFSGDNLTGKKKMRQVTCCCALFHPQRKQGRLLKACPVNALRFEFNDLRYTRALDPFIRAYCDRGTGFVSAWVIVKGWRADRMRTAGMQIILRG